ncbi:hypothetical protein SAMN05421504_101731 [Amycolatopsis xylanica]|uniref:LGFP repeat-containing protein n=1 Tax=Amycolatopsis xylanica TaxID=589385 RepID=A0A1H2U0H7_9PSEU|nr:glycoside hydrolase family 55 protein [Amycolatopsis xylanica]SDW49059.1 hypothetical protein SAMN05421504_101731 [Amycolatopsis xylanica]
MSRRKMAALLATAACVTAGLTGLSPTGAAAPGPGALTTLDTSAGNRATPVPGLYDWSKAGFRGGQNIPGASAVNPSAACQITAAQLASTYRVKPDDGADDTAGIQAAIDKIHQTCSPSASYDKLSLITFPAGTLNVTHEIHVDANYLILRGAGMDKTKFVYKPDKNTEYDVVTPDGDQWDQHEMNYEDGSGGWLWPGRGLFRVQSRGVDPSYASQYKSAPANRKDIFEGTVNVHWKVGAKLAEKPGDKGFAARTGDKTVYLASGAKTTNMKVGGFINIRAANSMKFYQSMNAVPTTWPLQNLHMRQQWFTITAVDAAKHTVSIDKPLEYDVPVDSTSDGSQPIDGTAYASKASPIVDPIVGVGFEDFSFTQAIDGLTPEQAKNNYGNLAPSQAMQGIVFKWAANSWVRGIHSMMTGSHPIVTEEAKNLQFVNNELDGSWNKGKGGNGYFRGSRVWDSLYAGNTTRNLRHFTFQWSASGNVVIGNDIDSDFNIHGGYERNNLFEQNTNKVAYNHRSGSCTAHCGDEGNSGPDDSTWFPIYWSTGQKAVKWSGSSGYRNVFFNNSMSKQVTSGAAYTPYYPDHHKIYVFGSDGAAYHHLDIGGKPIADWAHNEQADYTGGHGVDASKTSQAKSLFLKN